MQRGFDDPGWGTRNNEACETHIELAESTATNLDGEFASVVNTRELMAG